MSLPRYVHLPLLHGPDGKKLSKRHGAASVQELRDAGYLPAAVRNYLALLGWGTDDDTTIMSTPELVQRFDVARIGRASAVFDEQKLRWLNGRFMRELDPGEYAEQVAGHLERAGIEPPADRAHFAESCAVAQDKAQTLDEVWPLIRFVFAEPVDDEKARRKFLGPDGIADARSRAPGAGRARPNGLPRRWRRCWERSSKRSAQARSRLSADPSGDHRQHRLAGDLRFARPAGARREPEAHLACDLGLTSQGLPADNGLEPRQETWTDSR